MFGISAFAEAPFASLAGQTVVVELTGVSSSGAVGNVEYSLVPNGAQATGAVGTVTVGERFIALTGVGATGEVGNTSFAYTAALTGIDVTGAVGTVIPGKEFGITGVAGDGAVGDVDFSPIPDGVLASGVVGTVGMGERFVALTGVGAVGAVGDVTETNNPTEDGVVAYGSVGSIPLTTRTVALSGVSARGQVGTPLTFYWTTIDDSETPNWQNVEMVV